MNNDIADGLGLPPIPVSPPPPPPTPTPEPLAIVPTPTEPVSSGLPPLEPIAPPTPPAETAVSVPPVILADAGIHSNRFPIESGMTEEEKPKEESPKKKVNKKLVFGGTLVLLLLGGALALAAQLGLFRGDLRQRASGPCGSSGDNHCGSDGYYECQNNQFVNTGWRDGCQPGGESAPPPPPATEAPAPPSTGGGGSCSEGVTGLGGCCAAGKIEETVRRSDCSTYTRCERSWSDCGTAASVVTSAPAATTAPTAAPTTASGTGGGGGGGCDGSLSASVCKGKNPGSIDTNDDGTTDGICTVTTGNNCAFDWNAENCVDSGVPPAGKSCCSGVQSGGSCMAAGRTGGTTPTPTAIASSGTGGERLSDRPKTACYSYNSSGVCTSWDPTGSKPADLNVAGCNLYNPSGVCVAWDATTGGEKPGDTTRTKPVCNIYNSTGNCISWNPTGPKPADLNVAGCRLYLTSGVCVAWDAISGGERLSDRPKTVCNLYSPTGICLSWDPTRPKPTDLSISGCQRYNSSGTCIAWIPTLGTCNTYNSTGICISWDPTGSKPADLNVAGCNLYNPGGTCIAWDAIGGVSSPNGSSGGLSSTSGGVCAGLGGLNQICRVPQNCGNAPNCDGGLICDNGTCKAISLGSCGSGPSGCRVHNCSICSNYGGGLDECRSGGTVTDCASAKLSGSCGQIDLLDAEGNYCGVMQQACTGSCAGGVTTMAGGGAPAAGGGEPAVGGGTQSPTGTVPPGGLAGACVATRLYINSSPTPATPAQIAALRIGDTIRLAVRGNLASFIKGRFVIKLDNSVLTTQETTTKQNLPGDAATFEFIYDYTITQGGNYSIEGSIWQ